MINARGTIVIAEYVIASGSVYPSLPMVPSPEVDGRYILVSGSGSGLYLSVGRSWSYQTIDKPGLFYDQDMKRFYRLLPNQPAQIDLVGEPIVNGDILIDGGSGQIYIYNNGSWYADPRRNIRGPAASVTTAIIVVTENCTIPSQVRTVIVDRRGIELRLPKIEAKVTTVGSFQAYETTPITIVNVSRGSIVVKCGKQENVNPGHDRFTIQASETVTLQLHGTTWYVIG